MRRDPWPRPSRPQPEAVLWEDELALGETFWTQPALFAIEVATASLWQSFGLSPGAVIGHSLGEYAAACVAGVFTLADGLRLVAERARLTQSLPDGGAMAALFASPEEVATAIAPYAARLTIAAVNADDNVVISGDASAIERVISDCAARNIEARRLQVSFAAHSPHVEPLLDALEKAARSVPMQAPSVPIAWNRGGLSLACPDPSYWRHHLRDPVQFRDGIKALHSQAFGVFLEVGPHPTLMALAQRTLGEDAAAGLLRCAAVNPHPENWQGASENSTYAALISRGRPQSRRPGQYPGQPIRSSIGCIGWRLIRFLVELTPVVPLDIRSSGTVLPPLRPSSRHVFLRRRRPNSLTIAFKARRSCRGQPFLPRRLHAPPKHSESLQASRERRLPCTTCAARSGTHRSNAIGSDSIGTTGLLCQQSRRRQCFVDTPRDWFTCGDYGAGPARSEVAALRPQLGPEREPTEFLARLAALGVELDLASAFRAGRNIAMARQRSRFTVRLA